jgi:nucleoside-specific outer membrane channel protein Tsx
MLVAVALITATRPAAALEWSDTALGVRYGTTFAEPFDNNADGSRKDIKKAIVSLTHADGYKYGTNYFNLDMLMSDHNDPADGVPGNTGAQEAYVVYRNTLDIGKVLGQAVKFGPVRGVGATVGFDWNTKNDGYGSKKRMFVIGPTVMFDVPGFLNADLLLLDESNSPNGVPCGCRYHYQNHAALSLSWGIPVASLPLSFNGYALYIGSKGTNEFGGPTAPETHFDGSLMLDAGKLAGGPQHTFLVGLEYEYWRNKFGNPTVTPGAGPGATARTPMVRAEYHF